MASIKIDAAWLNALDRYVEDLHDDVYATVEVTAHALHEHAVERARNHREWSQYADNIDMWVEGGLLNIGIKDEEVVSQAFALEYGDNQAPPTGFFRNLQATAPHFASRYASRYGTMSRGYDAVKRNTR